MNRTNIFFNLVVAFILSSCLNFNNSEWKKLNVSEIEQVEVTNSIFGNKWTEKQLKTLSTSQIEHLVEELNKSEPIGLCKMAKYYHYIIQLKNNKVIELSSNSQTLCDGNSNCYQLSKNINLDTLFSNAIKSDSSKETLFKSLQGCWYSKKDSLGFSVFNYRLSFHYNNEYIDSNKEDYLIKINQEKKGEKKSITLYGKIDTMKLSIESANNKKVVLIEGAKFKKEYYKND